MKFLIPLFLSFFYYLQVSAQSDTVSLFHNSTSAASNKSTNLHKNAINWNLFQLTRGGILVNYERILGNSGFAITAGIGVSVFDPIGQFYVKKFAYYYKPDNYYSNERETTIRALYDIGAKYYFDKEMGGSYLGTGFTSIANTVGLSINNYDANSALINSSKYQLDYRSNEIKFLIGFENENDNQFYNDFNFGFGYRMINYENLVFTNTTNPLQPIEVSKVNKTNQTPWLFMSWKVGLRF